ncbi:MAG: hypothetical protein E7627_00660 [Ruminococcaceae bacterium]|nr:hypothetical protein [Oscillospiraceae bacterium]
MTLFTSDIDTRNKSAKTALVYLLVSIFAALFGAVYEKFSHGVYSYSMLYAFAYPLILGVLPYLCIAIGKDPKLPPTSPRLLCHFGVATLTVGSIIQGVLDIYGTMNYLTYVYPVIGALLYLAGVVSAIVSYKKK